VTFPTINTVPDNSKLTPLDPSGGFILQASIEIADSNSTELKEKASQQILAMKETLRASVNLLPGDRLALDTRVPVRRVR
jgi:mediator of RNA polymerase II transcription subunit 18, fungi type